MSPYPPAPPLATASAVTLSLPVVLLAAAAIADPAPPPDWQMPQVVQPAPPAHQDRGGEPASPALLCATTVIWLLAIVLGTLAALMAKQ